MSENVYEIVTARIIEQLKNAVIPWEKPWTGTFEGAYNRISKQPYSLLNQMLLKHSGEYATFKQWLEIGGHVRKGEKSEIVVFWKIYPVEQQDEANEKVEKDYWAREHIKVNHIKGDQAFYSPVLDMIQLPLFEQFKQSEEYYSTAFHESIHSTMKESRCNRTEEKKGKVSAFGSEEYSKEELVAEIGSANLMNRAGIETKKSFKNSAAYIQNWLEVLKCDSKFIVSASSRAEKAVKYILNEEKIER